MNVWIESPFDNLPQEGYRAQRYWLMAQAFAEAGHPVVYWTGDFSHASKSRRRFVQPLDGEVAKVKLIPTPSYFRNVSLRRVFSHRVYAARWKRLAIEAVRSRELPPPDLIIASMPTISAAAAALELGEKFGAKTAIDMMDAWPDTFYRLFPGWARPLAGVLFAPLHRKVRGIFRKAGTVSGVCRSYGAMVAGWGVEDFHLAYHGIDMAGAGRSSRKTSDGRLHLVYAGNLGRTYDLGTVLKALAADGNATLDIAGSGPLEGRWREMAAELGLGGRVRFHGYLGEEALARLLAGCHLGMIPMSAESFVGLPYKLCDYVKASLGVASSLEGECNALIREHGIGVAYAPGDAQSLAAAISVWRQRLESGPEPDFAGLAAMLDAKGIYRRYADIFLKKQTFTQKETI
jgi:glycosyltransferase involved in cell wall biosynthesis